MFLVVLEIGISCKIKEQDFGNGVHNFSAKLTVIDEQAGVHNQVQVNMRWDKEFNNNESVMGSYCFFDLPKFRIEEVIED